MQSMWISILMGPVLLLVISSCATVPTEPLGQGELRLSGVSFSDSGNINPKARCTVNIQFEAKGTPEITRVGVAWGGASAHYTNKMEVSYENRLIRVDVPTPEAPGSYGFKAWVYYIREGRIEQSNSEDTSVLVRKEGKKQKSR